MLFKFLFNELEMPGSVSAVKNLPWQFYAAEAALLLGSSAVREDPAQEQESLLLQSRDSRAGVASPSQPGPSEPAVLRVLQPHCVFASEAGEEGHTVL